MVLRIGHRGAAGHLPENTIASFSRALELEVDMIELDVHICGSGELVVIHDDTVDRTTNGTGKVSEMDIRSLSSLDAGRGGNIPTLEDVLSMLDGRCAVNVELKGPGTAARVFELLCHWIGKGPYERSDFLVTSFQPIELFEFSKLDPGIDYGFLFDGPPSGMEEFIMELGGQTVHPRFDMVTEEFINRSHDLGLKVNVWTVNDPDDIQRMIGSGVDGIISDRPERIPR